MDTLNQEEMRRLVDYVLETSGTMLTEGEFSELIWILFEDIPAMETVSPSKSGRYLRKLWSLYMAKSNKKPTQETTAETVAEMVEAQQENSEPFDGGKIVEPTANLVPAANEIDLSDPRIQSAINAGLGVPRI